MRGVLLVASAVLLPALAGAQRTGRQLDTSLVFDRRGSIHVTGGSATVILTGCDGDRVRVHATAERSPIRFDVTPTRIVLELASPRTGDARFEVCLPRGVRIVATTQSGDVSVRGTRGDCEIHTRSGDVVVDDVGERVDISTFNGDVRVRGTAGSVDVSSQAGDIDVIDARGDVVIESTSGELTVRGSAGRLVRAKTTSGDVAFAGEVLPTGRYEFHSINGSIDLTLPGDVGAQVSIATYNGAIESAFPITIPAGTVGLGRTKQFTFQLGSGSARVSAESVNGDITLLSARRSTR